MDDERVEMRAVLGLEDFENCVRVEGIGSEAIDGLSGDGDGFPCLEQFRRLLYGCADGCFQVKSPFRPPFAFALHGNKACFLRKNKCGCKCTGSSGFTGVLNDTVIGQAIDFEAIRVNAGQRSDKLTARFKIIGRRGVGFENCEIGLDIILENHGIPFGHWPPIGLKNRRIL